MWLYIFLLNLRMNFPSAVSRSAIKFWQQLFLENMYRFNRASWLSRNVFSGICVNSRILHRIGSYRGKYDSTSLSRCPPLTKYSVAKTPSQSVCRENRSVYLRRRVKRAESPRLYPGINYPLAITRVRRTARGVLSETSAVRLGAAPRHIDIARWFTVGLGPQGSFRPPFLSLSLPSSLLLASARINCERVN